MRRILSRGLLPLSLALSALSSHALDVSPVKGYSGNTEKTKAMDIVKVWAVCGTSYCEDTPPGKRRDIELVGRIREQTYFNRDKALLVGPAIVAREYAEVAKRQGGKIGRAHV